VVQNAFQSRNRHKPVNEDEITLIKACTVHKYEKICLTSITKVLHVFPEVDSKHSESEWNQDSDVRVQCVKGGVTNCISLDELLNDSTCFQ
jgi:uroporphyrinogen-III synthase